MAEGIERGDKEKEFKEALQKKLGNAYGRWFAQTELNVDGNFVKVSFPQQFSVDYVRQHYGTSVQEIAKGIGLNISYNVNPALAQAQAGQRNLELEVETARQETTIIEQSPREKYAQQFKDLETSKANLNPKRTFERFILSGNNEDAFRKLNRMLDQPEEHEYPSTFIFSGAGLGKTHLAEAVVWEVLRRKKQALEAICREGESAGNKEWVNYRALYIKADDFETQFTMPFRKDRNLSNEERDREEKQFKNKFEGLNLLVVDDVQHLNIGEKTKTREKMSEIADYLIESGGLVVVTSDTHPDELGKLPARLKTRLSSGARIPITKPSLSARLDVFYEFAKRAKVPVSKGDEAENLLSNVLSNIDTYRGISSLVASISAYYRAAEERKEKYPVFAKVLMQVKEQFVTDTMPLAPLNVAELIRGYACEIAGFQGNLEDFLKSSNPRYIATIRTAMVVAERFTKLDAVTIARVFGRNTDAYKSAESFLSSLEVNTDPRKFDEGESPLAIFAGVWHETMQKINSKHV